MEFWINVWGLILAVVLLLYTGLFVWVTAGGMSHIRAMLASLERDELERTHPEAKRNEPRP
ncbi:MAG TPA: hypothetical protein PLJ12_15315 [Planctomycetota bacterium]|nr:hypothetical protein [Planctomycetota bacterium]